MVEKGELLKMGELTNKVGRDDKARLNYLKKAGWGKPINMFCSTHKTATDKYKEGWERIWGNKKTKTK